MDWMDEWVEICQSVLIPNLLPMLDNKLIESALQLTSKTEEEMDEIVWWSFCVKKFSIEKFWWYLISQEFSSAYYSVVMCNEEYIPWREILREHDAIAINFLMALREYQSGDSQPLIELLSNIK